MKRGGFIKCIKSLGDFVVGNLYRYEIDDRDDDDRTYIVYHSHNTHRRTLFPYYFYGIGDTYCVYDYFNLRQIERVNKINSILNDE